ncbi:HAMP domain-containing histidine kinase [bacterium]|nr:HAMP domain-containing histidine kinase [bacterium]
MRLMWKTTLTSAVLVLAAFVVAGVFMIFLLTRIMNDEIDEHLLRLCDRAQRQIALQQQPRDADVRVLGTGSVQKTEDEFQDVMLRDGGSEAEPFRVLHAIRTVRDTAYAITVRSSRLESEDLSEALLLVFLLAGGFLVLTSVIVHGLVARRLWKPFYSTLDLLRDFSVRDDADIEWSATRTREFAEMTAALDALTARVRNEYSTLKEFTENASHELQTPLSVLRTKLDRLRQDIAPGSDAAHTIASMETALDRLTRLNRSLLLLARLENRQYDIGPGTDLGALVSRQITTVRELFDSAGYLLETDIAADAHQPVNQHLFDIMLSNLLSNALRYTANGRTVRVTLNTDTLSVENPGDPPDVPVEDLFKRFRKAGGDTEATGLGLSIVREIAAFHRWKVTYRYEKGMHIVTVHFHL